MAGVLGVMSFLAMVGYRRYINAAQSSEAKDVIVLIRNAQESYKAGSGHYLYVSSNINSFYPNPTPDNQRTPWASPAHPDYASWNQLMISPSGPVRFGFACIAGTAPTNSMAPLGAFLNQPTLPTLVAGTQWY